MAHKDPKDQCLCKKPLCNSEICTQNPTSLLPISFLIYTLFQLAPFHVSSSGILSNRKIFQLTQL
uniref:Uncharacterized protein n=1 Tax=Manihot esculenta TaxID=3983 RepID=A0A2C9UEF2_MANES